MLNKRTVLILGAGASEPFGFPIGIDLSNAVYTLLQPNTQQFQSLTRFGIPAEQLLNFRDTFYYSGKNSLDAFLEHRTDLIPIGKAVTAEILIGKEHSWQLFRFDNRNWLRYLYNNMNTSFDEFGANKLSIVTFNYDRTVEHFLFTSLKNSYDKSDDECAKAISAIPIIHLHGSLGRLPWQGNPSRSYEPITNESALTVAASSIKIIHEDISDGRDRDFERAKELLAKAEQVRCLGFGYNSINMERLGLASLSTGLLQGTKLGMGTRELQSVGGLLNGKIVFLEGDCFEVVSQRLIWG